MTALITYGSAKQGYTYRVLDTGYDYYSIAVHGRALCVPKWVFDD